MVKVSNRTRLNAGIFGKIILTLLLSIIAILVIVLVTYKPAYSVKLDGEFVGYVNSKNQLQQSIEEYLQEGDSERVAYILLNTKPEYEFNLVKKNTVTKDEEILADIKSSCDVYYKVYAVNVNDVEKCLASTLLEAQSIVDKVNEQQKNYAKKANLVISERYEKEFDAVEDIELAANDIIAPLKKANDEVVKKVQVYAAKKVVPQAILDALRSDTSELKFTVPMTSYVVTSRYGWRRSGYHTGVDYAAPIGTPIYAIEDGVVTCAQWSGSYGYLVKVQHTGGFETYYAHMSRFACSAGDEVKKGDLIGYVGSTGNSTGPHCHLEIRYDGATIDPQTLTGENG